MTLLTTAGYRAFEATALGDVPLQVLLDAAESEITYYIGDLVSGVELFGGGQRFLNLARPAASITSVVETTIWDGVQTTLNASDYILYPGGFSLQRIGTGPNPRWYWYGRISITYVPQDDLAIRKSVQVDLVKLALSFAPGSGSETIGAWSETFRSALDGNQAQRDAILGRLSVGPSFVVVGG